MKKEKEGSLVNKKKIIITIILAMVIFLTGGVGGFSLLADVKDILPQEPAPTTILRPPLRERMRITTSSFSG